MAIREGGYSHAKADQKKAAKRNESDARLAKRRKLSDTKQIAKLDSMFGKGKGAQRERTRFNARTNEQ